ncbi:MAG: molecular chaperone GrpE [Candidatus Woesearchaeota archaeon]|nr:molecular chaperone GrpE [Candidatus Woesearchaeota archaeon]MDN5328036.1 molecular chaperone GrpE [Candidatus Woesearchaeota archaeon]
MTDSEKQKKNEKNEMNEKHEKQEKLDEKDSKEKSESMKKGENIEQELSNRIQQLEDEKKELEKLVKRVAADFDNYRKTVEREKDLLIKNSSRRIIEKILPVLDNFELALKDPKLKDDPFVKGVELIYSQLLSLLEQEGLKPYNPLGEKFDPKTCEILLVKTDDKEEDMKIVDVIQKGYFLNDVLIRPAKVVVVKRGEKDE